MKSCFCGRSRQKECTRFRRANQLSPWDWSSRRKVSAYLGNVLYIAHVSTLTCIYISPLGAFAESVKWILVVTTPSEVLLFLLYRESEFDSSLKIKASTFILATDNVRMLSVAGTNDGRIFLGGDDGCLYEMLYQDKGADSKPKTEEEILKEFYEQGKEVKETIYVDGAKSIADTVVSLGKRSLGFGGSITSSDYNAQRPRKCRKLNRTSSVSSWVSAVVPGLLLKAAGLLFGGKTSTGGGPIKKMVVDEDRDTLYTLSQTGMICSFSIRDTNVQLAAVMETPRVTQDYLMAVSRGQMNPSGGGSFGSMSFNGSGLAAQAGVGGMEGARAILKYAELQKKGGNGRGQKYDDSLAPVSIHVIPTPESQRLTLLAVTGCGLRLYLSSLSSNSKSLLPSRYLTLCHIRAPPPIDAGAARASVVDESGFVGGIKPQAPGRDKYVRVDAAFYKDGVFMAAIEYKKADLGRTIVGDTIVASCPEPAFQSIERANKENEDDKEEFVLPGGIVEKAFLPMQEVLGPDDGSNSVLPGGVIVDIAPISERQTSAMILARNSLTPTDNELRVGLPAEYSPPQKLGSRSDSGSGLANDEPTTSIVVRDASLSGSIVSVIGKVFPNSLLAQAMRQGVAVPLQASDRFYGKRTTDVTYRMSERDGVEGYSLTAAETGRTLSRPSIVDKKARTVSTSVRLRQWLLRPPTVPLNVLATQHLLEPKQVVALNAGGLHYFGIDNILVALSDALVSAGENVASDQQITSFFVKFGYKEGCAMCLSLAAGCGPANGQSSASSQLRERAATAAIARSFSPRLSFKTDDLNKADTMVHSTSSSSDPLVPPGYEFHPSELCKGLTALVARLLRPVWYKPAVVVTEGRFIKSAWSAAPRTSPAKVEVLISEEKLQKIREPLVNLQLVMKRLFTRALANVPGASKKQPNLMDIDEDIAGDAYVTRALQYQSQLHSETGGGNLALKPAETERLARLIEERDIHSLYRLLSRAVQILDLMFLLYKADRSKELNEVEWGLLHGLTVAQLVGTGEGQDRVERLLNSLVMVSAAEGVGKIVPSAMVDQIANQLSEQCFNFFSPGSRSAYLGFLRANEALENPVGSTRRLSLTNQAGNHFREAAKHWYSAQIISGRILHSRGKENFRDIAIRAFEHQSPLARAGDVLVRLGDVASVVEICLLTARNFQTNNYSSIASVSFAQQITQMGPLYQWEQQLYQRRHESNVMTMSPGNRFDKNVNSTQIVAEGISVTLRDAIDTCYSLVFYFFSKLMAREPQLAYSMVSACAATSDESFLQSFFRFLLDNGYVETLLMIDSPAVEQWLQDRKDQDLLWRYYTVQKRSFEAGEVCFSRATDKLINLSLDDRVESLSRAVTAFSSKLEEVQGIAFGSAAEAAQNTMATLRERLSLARDMLRIARIQKRILGAVDSRRANDTSLGLSDDLYALLVNQLIPASDLYNDYAAPLYLFEHCLLILHACKHDGKPEIHRLWINLIAEEILPCVTRDANVFEKLRSLLSDIGQAEDVRLLGPDESAGSLSLFETGDWAKRVEARVIGLGSELYGTGADYVFPVDYLLNLFEGVLQSCCYCCVTCGCPMNQYLSNQFRALQSCVKLWDSKSTLPGHLPHLLDLECGFWLFWIRMTLSVVVLVHKHFLENSSVMPKKRGTLSKCLSYGLIQRAMV